MRSPRKWVVMMLFLFVIGVAGCQKDGPAESAGKKIDKALEKAGKAVEDAGEKIQEKAK